MIASVNPLPVGNALRISLEPPEGSKLWNLLRSTSPIFVDQNDPDAFPVATSSRLCVIVDSTGLDNGLTYYYKAFYWDGALWSADATATFGVPAANYVDVSAADPLALIQERLRKGFAIEVARSNVTPGPNSNGIVDVLLAPPVFDETPFPVVVVHLDSERPDERFLGEDVLPDYLDSDDQWALAEGWLARTNIRIEIWSLNADERILLRLALRRIIVANFPVFAGAGLREPTLELSDSEDFKAFNAPVYWTIGQFSCLTPVAVAGKYVPVRDIDISIQTYQNRISASIPSRSN